MAGVTALVSYRIKDSDGVVTSKEHFFTFDDTKTWANVSTYINSYAAVLDAVTEGQIVQQVVRIIVGTAGLKSAPLADSDNEETMLTDYVQSGTFYHWGDDVPAVIDAAELAGGRLDLTNANVAAYTTFVTTAHSGFQPAGRLGNSLVALASGMVTFRKLRKQLAHRGKSFPA